ncbi:hypothetical protein ACFUIY_14685 [Streptomyces griseorubiginosus]|uniref:hypothetical protein n=1 Tax=Streptomyces griseorubiginosus TaxID=67304 RepID=UPI00364051F0
MKIYVIQIDPVQEVAAERATLDRFTELLSQHPAGPSGATHEALARARMFGWPLVYDDSLPPGFVYCRPRPGSAPPPSPEEIEQYLSAFMSATRPTS